MAGLEGKIKIPLMGEVGKKPALIGGGIFALFIGVLYIRHRNNAASTNASPAGGTAAASAGDTGLVTDPAGNQCSAVDPNSGYCPGTQEDAAYQSDSGYGAYDSGLYGSGAGDYGGYTGSGYGGAGLYVDPNGNTCEVPGPDGYCPTTGGGATGKQYANNEAWLVAAESALHSPALAEAAERIFAGLPVTANQKDVFLEAAGTLGTPPPDGYPTPIKLKDTKAHPGPSGKVSVPNVIGERKITATAKIRAAGLTSTVHEDQHVPGGKEAIVVSTNPDGGDAVDRGSHVTINVRPR